MNIDHRQLNREQKRALIAESIKADPQLSNREHAKRTGATDPTVGVVRRELEEQGEVQKFSTSIGVDGKSYPASKPRPEPERETFTMNVPTERTTTGVTLVQAHDSMPIHGSWL